jgi:hypothetical protein
MRNLLLIVLFFLIGFHVNAKEFSGFYVTLEQDTIECKFKVSVNLFNNKLLNQLSFRKRIKVIDEQGLIKKIKPTEVLSFQIDDTSEGSETYVPLEVDGKMWFVRLVQEGALSLYEYFYPHGYDGSVMISYVLKQEGKESARIPAISWRKKLLKYLGQDDWMVKELEQEGVKYKHIPDLVANYNLKTVN